MKPHQHIDALTLLSDVEARYEAYQDVNRQKMFNFSRFIGRNINFNVVRTHLLAREYDSFDNFVNHLRTVFIQDLQFYSEYSRWMVPFHGLDFIQRLLRENPKLDMQKARSVLHMFVDKTGHENVMIVRYSPSLFDMKSGLCLSSCIMRLETQRYSSMDELYDDLTAIGRQYCDSIPEKRQSLDFRLLSLQLQVDFNLRIVKEREAEEEFRKKRMKWCDRYMLRYKPGKSFNVLYFLEEVIPGLDKNLEKERTVDFNRWYKRKTAGTLLKGDPLPDWMISLAEFDFESKEDAVEMFKDHWDTERMRENQFFAHWLFEDPARVNLPNTRAEFRKVKEEFVAEFSDTSRPVYKQWRETEGGQHQGKGGSNVFKQYLREHVEYEQEYAHWLLHQWGGKGSNDGDYDEYRKKVDAERIQAQSDQSTFHEWCDRNGYSCHSGKGPRWAFNESRNVSQYTLSEEEE